MNILGSFSTDNSTTLYSILTTKFVVLIDLSSFILGFVVVFIFMLLAYMCLHIVLKTASYLVLLEEKVSAITRIVDERKAGFEELDYLLDRVMQLLPPEEENLGNQMNEQAVGRDNNEEEIANEDGESDKDNNNDNDVDR